MIKENTDAALLLGLQVWNLQVGKEDVVDLFNKTYYRNPL
jgi:putative hydrolase of the HAD superfamily